MSPLAVRIAWIIGGAAALLWFASQRRGSSGSGGTVARDPESGWQGRAHLSDLCRSHAPAGAIIPNGYDPCNYFKHIPTGTWGTLQQLSSALGISPADWGGTVAEIGEKPSWYIIYHDEPCAGGPRCEENA